MYFCLYCSAGPLGGTCKEADFSFLFNIKKTFPGLASLGGGLGLYHRCIYEERSRDKSPLYKGFSVVDEAVPVVRISAFSLLCITSDIGKDLLKQLKSSGPDFETSRRLN